MSLTVTTDINDAFARLYTEFEKNVSEQIKQPTRQIRESALAAFQIEGLPGTKHEEYKYTAITKKLDKSPELLTLPSGTPLQKADIEPHLFGLENANELVFINGVFSSELSTIVTDDSQLEIKSLELALTENATEVKQAITSFSNREKDAFNYLNTAFLKDGLFLKVKANKVVEEPICIYNFIDTRASQCMAQPRNLIIAETNSQAKIVEFKKTIGAHTSFVNTLTQIILKQDAVLDHYKIQHDQEDSILVSATQAVHEAKSVFNNVTVSLKGGLIRNNLDVVQNASYCESNMYGLYFLDGKTHVDNHTSVDHTQPHAESNELYKGILDGQSTAVFNGKIFVRQAAQKTNAFQSNRNVLLTDNATINTKPQLEIWADDVKCSHGCTVGQLNEDQLFYLRARGLSKESARAMLLNAFAEDVLNHIKIEDVHKYLTNLITKRLESRNE